tara:strand:+ start:43 stop:354 length:312 start_codon:yes stop_codon:yes gene_type:complete
MSSIAAADVSRAAEKAAKVVTKAVSHRVAGVKRKRTRQRKRGKLSGYGAVLLQEVKRAEEQLLKHPTDFVRDLVILGGLHECPRCHGFVSDLTRCPVSGNHWD